MTYSVLGIDTAMTKTGWAHYREGDDKPTWGVRRTPSWNDDEGKYLWEFFEWLGNLCVDKAVTHIFVEDCRFKTAHSENLTQMLASIGLIAQATIVAFKLTERGQPIELFAAQPQQWRKTFLGVMPKPEGINPTVWRKTLKEAAVSQCHIRGWLVESDDEADALGVMTYGICTIDATFLHQQGPLFRKAENMHDKFVRENK